MTESDQRLAIAEACGLHFKGLWDSPNDGQITLMCVGQNNEARDMPDYIHDLNAMHEAVMYMRDDLGDEFVAQLRRLIISEAREASDDEEECWVSEFLFYNATAVQRAEAFLRALGLWID